MCACAFWALFFIGSRLILHRLSFVNQKVIESNQM